MADFFTLLRTKIEIEPDRAFDQRFWAAFELENPTRSSAWDHFKNYVNELRAARRFAIASAVASAVVGFGLYLHSSNQHLTQTLQPDLVAVNDMMANQAMLGDLDLFATFEDISSITDEDWKVLLENG